MIRTLMLIGLLAVIFYCAFADSARGREIADAGGKSGAMPALRSDLRDRRQFIPGSMAAVHGHARDAARVVLARAATAEPNA